MARVFGRAFFLVDVSRPGLHLPSRHRGPIDDMDAHLVITILPKMSGIGQNGRAALTGSAFDVYITC
jgi:hypothetical protein